MGFILSKKLFSFSRQSFFFIFPEAALQRCFYEKVFWKYAANLQENTHAKVRSAWVFICKFAAYFQNITDVVDWLA